MGSEKNRNLWPISRCILETV